MGGKERWENKFKQNKMSKKSKIQYTILDFKCELGQNKNQTKIK